MPFLDANALESDAEGMALLQAIIGERRSRAPKPPAWPRLADSPSLCGRCVQSGTALPLRRTLSGLRDFVASRSQRPGRSSGSLGSLSREVPSMTLTVLDPCTGNRVTITVPERPESDRRAIARRWVLRELDRSAASTLTVKGGEARS